MTEPVSLIFTVKDEAKSLKPFLAALASQTRLPDEIIVVDGGSMDGTTRVLEDSANSLPMLKIFVAQGASISKGRNLAIDQAKGPIIAVTDAGTVAATSWLEELVRPLELDPQAAVSSGFFLPGGASPFERSLTTIITPQLFEIDPDRFLPSSRSVAFRKDWWATVGGYPVWLQHCEDLVFDMALKRQGGQFRFAPEALVTWTARRNLRGFARQYFNYARGDGHAHLWTKRHAVRYGAYLMGAFLLVSSRRHRLLALVPAGGMLTYFSKFMRRLLKHPAQTRTEALLWAPLVPVVVVIGDVAKMIGYPVGLFQRLLWGGPKGLQRRFKENGASSARHLDEL